jgi:hypothetical protein
MDRVAGARCRSEPHRTEARDNPGCRPIRLQPRASRSLQRDFPSPAQVYLPRGVEGGGVAGLTRHITRRSDDSGLRRQLAPDQRLVRQPQTLCAEFRKSQSNPRRLCGSTKPGAPPFRCFFAAKIGWRRLTGRVVSYRLTGPKHHRKCPQTPSKSTIMCDLPPHVPSSYPILVSEADDSGNAALGKQNDLDAA